MQPELQAHSDYLAHHHMLALKFATYKWKYCIQNHSYMKRLVLRTNVYTLQKYLFCWKTYCMRRFDFFKPVKSLFQECPGQWEQQYNHKLLEVTASKSFKSHLFLKFNMWQTSSLSFSCSCWLQEAGASNLNTTFPKSVWSFGRDRMN